jgi:NTE family protein
MSSRKITTISLSSGGAKGSGLMGILARLIDEGITRKVTSWYGCSAGSFCAYLGALGVSSSWIRDCIQHFDMRPTIAIDKDILMNYMNSWGFASGKELVDLLGKFVDTWEPGASAWTFADLRKKAFLGITAVNLNKRKLELFSVDTHPNMRILDAIRASCTIPFVFTPWRSPSGDLYCDGAMIEQCPWFHIREKNTTLVIACEKSQIFGPLKDSTSIETFVEYCMRILVTQRPRLCRERPALWISVDSSVSSMNFDITAEERLALYHEGEAAADAWLKRSAGGTAGIHPWSVRQNTLSVPIPSGESVSDSHQPKIPSPSQAPSRDLRTRTGHSSRRWSV